MVDNVKSKATTDTNMADNDAGLTHQPNAAESKIPNAATRFNVSQRHPQDNL